mgnify:CR=1 FL=1
MLNLGFLASHGGSNMQSIIDWCKDGRLFAKPCCVISNNSNSFALQRARNENIPAYHISSLVYPIQDAYDDAIIDIFSSNGVDTVVLAGYMKLLGSSVIRHFKGRVLNIHPALLPKFGGKGMYGKYVHEAVIAAGEKFSGPSVHLVDEIYDNGRILSQIQIPVLPEDTPETLAKRVLEQEHIIYPQTLQKIALGEIVI